MLLNWQSDGYLACGALVLYGVILVALVLSRVPRRSPLARLMPAALAWHLAVWLFVAFWMLPYFASTTGADCDGYHHQAIVVAGLIRAWDWSALSWGVGTASMPMITGFLYAPFGGDIYGALFFSAAIGFAGAVYFCRAFALWVTDAQLRKYSLVILFLPSLATWTSMLGKDSWVALGLGLTAFGYSMMLRWRRTQGLWHVVLGVGLIAVIRSHIAVALAASMAFAYLLGLVRARRGSILTKFAMLTLLVAMFCFLAFLATGFMGLNDVSADGMREFAQTQGRNNAIGGSAVDVQIAPGMAGALLAMPLGVLRVLFQPFPWEIHNVNAGMAAAENLFILGFILSHAKKLRGMVRGMGREPYQLFSAVLAGSLLLMFSFIPNLGLLSRQRAQLLPFLFVPLVSAKALRMRGERITEMPPGMARFRGQMPVWPAPREIPSNGRAVGAHLRTPVQKIGV